MTPDHVCKPMRFCTCYSLALEPSEDCPIHGCPTDPERCRCGRFVKKEKQLDTSKICDYVTPRK